MSSNRFLTFGRAFAALSVVVFSASVSAQPKIVLQTTPGPTEIPLQSQSNVIIDPLTGDITATPADPAACTATGTCDAQVDVISFTVNPSTLNQGQSFSATFSQRGAWECERTGLPGTTWNSGYTAPPSSPFTVLVGTSVQPGNYTLTLRCRNGTSGGAAIDELSQTLTVNQSTGGGTPQFCIDEGRVPPSSWTQELNADYFNQAKTTDSWFALFETNFPQGSPVTARIRQNRYGAFFFNSGTTAQAGQIQFADMPGNVIGVNRAPALVSFSQCPGDFVPQSGAQARCRITQVGGANPSFQWTRLSSESAFRCLIAPNTEYYFNVTYVSVGSQNATNPENLVWECVAGDPKPCGHLLQGTVIQ
ncbi:MAG: hypothetical protein Kow0020_07620 [Wenzhouxiangellaceae bacterium]